MQVQSQEILCQKCGKKYKTRGGYERHQAPKHSERADLLIQLTMALRKRVIV